MSPKTEGTYNFYKDFCHKNLSWRFACTFKRLNTNILHIRFLQRIYKNVTASYICTGYTKYLLLFWKLLFSPGSGFSSYLDILFLVAILQWKVVTFLRRQSLTMIHAYFNPSQISIEKSGIRNATCRREPARYVSLAKRRKADCCTATLWLFQVVFTILCHSDPC